MSEVSWTHGGGMCKPFPGLRGRGGTTRKVVYLSACAGGPFTLVTLGLFYRLFWGNNIHESAYSSVYHVSYDKKCFKIWLQGIFNYPIRSV